MPRVAEQRHPGARVPDPGDRGRLLRVRADSRMSAPEAFDLVVIGGGPAGLTAARDVAAAGGRVMVVDENHAMGGKLRGQLHEDPADSSWWKGWELAEQAEKDAVDAGARMMTDVVAWGLEPGWTVRLTYPAGRTGGPSQLTTRAVLVATGAVERPMPVAGWTLPGAMTIGAAQVLTNIHRVKPGHRVLVVGMDVLSLTIARAMQLAGVDVVGIVLPPTTVKGSSPRATLGRLAPMAKLAPAKYMRLGGHFLGWSWVQALASRLVPRTLRMWGIPLHLRTSLVAIQGTDQVTGAALVNVTADGTPIPGSERKVAVDAVCLANGLIPLNELLATLDCSFVRSPDLGGTVPVHSDTLRTQLDGMYVAGNSIGIESAKIAEKQGALVALSIIDDLGLSSRHGGDAAGAALELMGARRTMEFQFDANVQRGHDDVQRAWEKSGDRA
ncbi:FAD-binding protein [Cryobacterium sp. TMT1-21]|nr:FAD-binding protein [Cryobacterium sp. TmT2-59]TFD17571.1 FAD-binding protein [Cryobacterium sp. TMT4-10]TFD18265.1 FAD-binding protein [Cryobacterium sp. TMT1-21]TFD24841.1 FAD-binding protein [Cryobacterium sp. TMT2-23]TFD38894.1 FAD-binding protein [Cryobacterium sp. TMT2-10]